ncbi:hypothetical protein V1525DRAFT_413064 [Lipomyces kononenkoae]|uniref:Uncharacterized protein n=1 Tax=Lipomyces kononenkoae TaxID=34357 RepID=A0ACC3STM5_LIPKO
MRAALLLVTLAASAGMARADSSMPGMEMPAFNMTEFLENYDPTSFFSIEQDRLLLLLHVSLMCLAFVILLPISLMLSIAKSPLHTPIHVVFLSVVALALGPSVAYKSRAPDLYPNNVHSKSGWILVLLLALHFFSGIFKTLLNWAIAKSTASSSVGQSTQQQYATVGASLSHESLHSANADSFSGSGASATLDGYDDEIDGLYSSEFGYQYTDAEHGGREYVLDTADDDDLEKVRLRHHPLSVEYKVQRFIANKLQPLRRVLARLPHGLLSNLHILANVVFALLNRPMVIYGFFQLTSGIVTATCIGRGNNVFSMLAHFIKGAVFVWVGILTFGRVLGAWANLGWAWNLRPPVPRARQSLGARFFQCSMEMVESGLIFFYGITNVFLEHLGSQDGKWTHKDLQHASIAFMFIGGGLCGILFESTTIRSLFNAQVPLPSTRQKPSAGQPQEQATNADARAAEPAQYGFSYNPFPLFTIFWTGILMSQHHQATELSTKIHMQWGYLLATGAVFRGITYIVMYLSPPRSYHPARPMTEVLVSFCLIAGGAVFMSSHGETVDAILYYGLDGMFIMNVTVGCTALFMSWLMVLMALKGWASKRRS